MVEVKTWSRIQWGVPVQYVTIYLSGKAIASKTATTNIGDNFNNLIGLMCDRLLNHNDIVLTDEERIAIQIQKEKT